MFKVQITHDEHGIHTFFAYKSIICINTTIWTILKLDLFNTVRERVMYTITYEIITYKA